MIARIKKDDAGRLWADTVELEPGASVEVLTCSVDGSIGWIETEVGTNDAGESTLMGILDDAQGLFCRVDCEVFI